jgi:hypothetical protein
MGKNRTVTSYSCKCGMSHAGIDHEATSVVCGVVGLVDYYNIHLFSGIVECCICKEIIYTEKKK